MEAITGENISLGHDLRGKTAIVTGANAGLGREVTRVLAMRGAQVVLACRSPSRAGEACEALVARHGEAMRPRLTVLQFDGDAVGSASDLVERLASDRRRVDWVFLNAGVFGQPFRRTSDGHEATLAINYLAHFMLVHRLLTSGVLAPDGRIIASLSEGVTHNPLARADIAAIEDPKPERHRAWMSSPNSKVLLALMLTELTRRAQATSYKAIACVGALPAASLTNNVNMGSRLTRLASSIIKPFFRPVEQGAACLVHAAIAPDISGPEVRFIDRHLSGTHIATRATDPAKAQLLWATTERVLRLAQWPDPSAT